MYFKRVSTVKDLLFKPKDRDTIWQKSGVIYIYKCKRVDCEDEYIGKSVRIFAKRYKEHMSAPSPIHDHHNIKGHDISINNFRIVGREDPNLVRYITEDIRVNDPFLNRNIGKFQLLHIWDEVLINSP